MISWEVGDGVFWSRSVSFKIACISLPVKPLIYNISIYWQGCRTRLSWGETQIPKRWALIVQVIIYWPRHYYSPWGYAFTSRLLRGCTLGVRPGQSVVTETQTPKAISKNLLEKVADPAFRRMLSGAWVACILTLPWKLSCSSWSIVKYYGGPMCVSNDHRYTWVRQMS